MKFRSVIQNTSITFLRPFKPFQRAHVFLLAWLIAGVGLVLSLSWLVLIRLSKFCQAMQTTYNFSDQTLARLLMLSQAMLCVLALPIILTLLLSPLRLYEIQGRLSLTALIKSFPTAAARCLATTFLALRSAIIILLPLLALAISYDVMIRKVTLPGTSEVYILAAIIVAIWAWIKLTPLTIAPFLAVLGNLNARDALLASREVVSLRRVKSLSLTLIILLGLPGLLYSFRNINPSSSPSQTLLLSTLSVLSAWYLVQLIGQTIIDAMRESFARSQLNTTPNLAEPSSTPPIDQKVLIHIDHLWLNKN